MPTLRPPLILGSTSPYRKDLLGRLGIPFETDSPQVDETPQPDEAPADLARRLALAKARAVAALHPQAVVIGSDQVADLDGRSLGKPGNHERAAAQLRLLSGRQAVFHTAVAVVRADTSFEEVALAPVTMRFRALHTEEIEHYLRLVEPYDCAGSHSEVRDAGHRVARGHRQRRPHRAGGAAADPHLPHAARSRHRRAARLSLRAPEPASLAMPNRTHRSGAGPA